MKEVLVSMLVRAVRSFLQGFAVSLAASAANVTDLSTAKSVVLAAGYAGAAALWRAFDTTPVPSLVDPHPFAGVQST